MSYWRELVVERRALISVVIAGSVAFGLNTYVNSLFIPHLLAEFGWSRADFAVTSTVALVGLLSYPAAGRLADRYGARPVALVGALALPITYTLFSLMTGDILQYFVIYTFMVMFAAGATVAVYGRILAVRIYEARGLALSLLMMGPPLVGAVMAPLLNDFIADHGWRAGYQVLAIFILVVGLSALAFVPGDRTAAERSAPILRNRAAYGRVFSSRAFWILAIGMILCNIGNALTGVQLTPMLLDTGAHPSAIGGLISLFAIGVILGRLVGGVSLDRLPTPIISVIGMGLPAIGLAMLAAGANSPAMLGFATLLLGFSTGAEGDIGGYAAARYIGPELFGTAYGLIVGIVSLSGSSGAFLLSIIIAETDSYSLFLTINAVTTAIGASLFLLLAFVRPHEVPPQELDEIREDAGGQDASLAAASAASRASPTPTG